MGKMLKADKSYIMKLANLIHNDGLAYDRSTALKYAYAGKRKDMDFSIGRFGGLIAEPIENNERPYSYSHENGVFYRV